MSNDTTDDSHNYLFNFGHNIPSKHLTVFIEKPDTAKKYTTAQLSVSEAEFIKFLRQFEFIKNYKALRGKGMYDGEEEECTELQVFGITKAQSEDIGNSYAMTYLQEDFYSEEIS
jgi:hypothetical protein